MFRRVSLATARHLTGRSLNAIRAAVQDGGIFTEVEAGTRRPMVLVSSLESWAGRTVDREDFIRANDAQNPCRAIDALRSTP